MVTFASVDKSQAYRAFMTAFADYAMDASGTTEESMMLRMAKNAVDFEASAGAYAADTGNFSTAYDADTGSFDTAYDADTGNFDTAYDADTGSLGTAYDADTGNFDTAYEGNRLVGFTLIGIDTIDGLRTAYDAGTGIIPEFRGQGLAKRMFDHALPELRTRGVKRFLLEVLQGNEPAIKAYEKSGFAISRELRCYAAATQQLRDLEDNCDLAIRSTDASSLAGLTSEASWTPSFENRFTAHTAIPGHVIFLGAYDGADCVGVISYCPDLNWLLSLLVKRSHRRRGVATALLKHLAETMPESRFKLAALNIDGKDQVMQDFLAALGFDHLIDQYEMVRTL